MDFDYILGSMLETARQRFIEKQGSYYNYMIKNGGREALPTWMAETREAPLQDAIKHAAVKHQLDDEEVLDMIEASLKFRVYAGILTRPVEYDSHGLPGHCANEEYDPELDGWVCKVPGNQAQADAWHARFGNSPVCPFYKRPDRDPTEVKEDELHKLLNEGSDVDEAFTELGLLRPKGDH